MLIILSVIMLTPSANTAFKLLNAFPIHLRRLYRSMSTSNFSSLTCIQTSDAGTFTGQSGLHKFRLHGTLPKAVAKI